MRRQEGGAISEFKSQAQYLRDLQQRHGLTLREIARRSAALADALGQPQLAFTHQAISAWLSGTRNPRFHHRQAMAMIFNVALQKMNHTLDAAVFEQIRADTILKPAVVVVHGNERSFEHRLTLRSDMDFSQPAVFASWTEIFRPFPARLVRHFSRLKYSLFGWIPDRSAYPLIRHARSLVPLEEHRALSAGVHSVNKEVWFVTLPGGKVDAGIAVRDGRWLVLSKPGEANQLTQRYPFSRIDLIGRVTAKPLFHLKGGLR
jgi:transcriptional regulator with XRE-family HTH domain